MPTTMQQLGIDRMSAEEKLQLIEEIWDSLSLEQMPIPESHRRELDRRLAKADANPSASVPWEDVLKRLERKYGKKAPPSA